MNQVPKPNYLKYKIMWKLLEKQSFNDIRRLEQSHYLDEKEKINENMLSFQEVKNFMTPEERKEQLE